uniref:Uncharacterized protein n=1 Tax=Rhizophora mucronata TaxID=61149 RepID=A0A2P2NR91_RHIMU
MTCSKLGNHCFVLFNRLLNAKMLIC